MHGQQRQIVWEKEIFGKLFSDIVCLLPVADRQRSWIKMCIQLLIHDTGMSSVVCVPQRADGQAYGIQAVYRYT